MANSFKSGLCDASNGATGIYSWTRQYLDRKSDSNSGDYDEMNHRTWRPVQVGKRLIF